MGAPASDPLVARLAAFVAHGDSSAMEELVRLTRPRLWRAARRIVGEHDAEDAVQSAYHALLRKGGDLDGAPPIAWLLTAVTRLAYRRKALTRREVQLARALDRPCAEAGPAARVERDESRRRLRAVLERLPGKYRDVLVLRDLQGLSSADTARLLEVPVSTVTTRLQRGRALLRARLGPTWAHSLLLVPWLLEDSARVLPWMGGGAMKVKTTLVVGGLVVAAGLVGHGTGRMAAVTGEVEPARRSGTPAARERQLESELAEVRGELRDARARLATLGAPAGEEAPPAAEKPAGPAAAVDPDAVLAKAAAELGVPAEILRQAAEVEEMLRRRDPDANAAVHALARHGEPAALAVVALLRAGRSGPWFADKLLPATWYDGLERLLIATAELPGLDGGSLCDIVDALVAADSPNVRDYLVERIGRENDPDVFGRLARALGRLAEDRGAPACAGKLLFDDPLEEADWGPQRPGVLYSLGRMGGTGARKVLEDFVRDSRATDPTDLLQALGALYDIDHGAASAAARTLLEDPRASALDEVQHRVVDNLARIGTAAPAR